MSLINASGWNTTKCINSSSKHEFLHLLIKQEVILKRLPAMDALEKGLEQLGVVTLLRQHPNKLKELFVYSSSALTADMFVQLMAQCNPLEMPNDHLQAYKWFLEYIKEREICKLYLSL